MATYVRTARKEENEKNGRDQGAKAHSVTTPALPTAPDVAVKAYENATCFDGFERRTTGKGESMGFHDSFML